MTTLRSMAGRWLRSCYHALPLSWPMRLKLKSAVFGTLSPLVRHTNAHKQWRRFSQAGDNVAPVEIAAIRSVPVSNSDAPEQLPVMERYASQVLSLPYARSPFHVAAPADAAPAAVRAKAIAFYLPQFHPIAENDAWWGKGFTEWNNVTRAVPQFIGHQQPKLPGELGFYDLRQLDVMRRQVELALAHGIHGFCFHHYWFAGRRLLERPVDQFLASDIDFPFSLCWANENWTRRWDGAEQDVLLGQTYTDDNDEAFIRDLIPYLRDRRYIRIDGKPLVVVYRPSLLPDCRNTLAHWRQSCRDAGIGEIFLAMVQFDVEDPRVYGFDMAIEFPPHKVARGLPHINAELEIVNPGYAGHVIDYMRVVQLAKLQPDEEFSLARGVFPSWDNEARKPGRGYTFAHSTPEAYVEWLEAAVDYAQRNPVAGERMVFINAWNEWAEGACLEPDRYHGYAYLHATRKVVEQPAIADLPGGLGHHRIVVVTHDAHPHGAQYLALGIAREIKALGLQVEIACLGNGVLLDDYRQVAMTHAGGSSGAAADGLVQRLLSRGVTHAICNTAVSGEIAARLSAAGVGVISLLHELPGVIDQLGLAPKLAAIARSDTTVVFAAKAVEDGVLSVQQFPAERRRVRPQGVYKRNRHAPGRLDVAREALRSKLGIPLQARIVVGVGYADMRKGIDLFVDAGRRAMALDPDVHFVWVGHADTGLEHRIAESIAASGHAERFHLVGRQADTDLYYAGADIFALTSREDPYPTVVMEAFDACLPVVAFRGAGGFEELLDQVQGILVPMEDANAFGEACAALLAAQDRSREMGARGHAYIERERSFRPYIIDLLGFLGIRYPRITVIVPNFNYARYLGERIGSIRSQALQPMEILVLDDASTDDSLQMLEQLRLDGLLPLSIHPNQANSGSVFQQWKRGAELAQGDLIWIAEADDLAEPGLLAEVVAALDDPGVAMSYSQSRQLDAGGTVTADDYLDYVAEFGSARWQQAFVSSLHDELDNGLAVKNTIPNVSAVVFRASALRSSLYSLMDEIGGYRVAGDWVAYVGVLEHGALAFAPRALNLHRRHAGSVTIGGDNAPHLREVLQVQGWIRQRHPSAQASRDRAVAYARRLHAYLGLDAGGIAFDTDPRFDPQAPACAASQARGSR